MKVYRVFTRKGMAVVLALLLVAICFASRYSSIVNAEKDGLTHENRIEFLARLGYSINPETESVKKIVIPDSFSDVYENYNRIQRSAGYDLKLYKGCKCEMYSYAVTKCDFIDNPQNFNANLIVYNGRIIGGDISSADFYGEMLPLKGKNEKTKN